MRSLFRYLTVYQNKNHIAIFNRRKPVSNKNRGATLRDIFNGSLDHFFRIRIEYAPLPHRALKLPDHAQSPAQTKAAVSVLSRN